MRSRLRSSFFAMGTRPSGRSSVELGCLYACHAKVLMEVLRNMRAWVDEIPPQKQSLICGNTAVRSAQCFVPLSARGKKLITCGVCSTSCAENDLTHF